jgi:hypothetical protein
VIALLAASALAAENWWVPDQPTADALASAAAAEWPGEEHRVMVGERPVGSAGWSWDGHVLTRSVPGEVRTSDAADAHVAVLLGRTWAIESAPAAPVYLPEALPPEPVAVSEPEPDRVQRPDGKRWVFSLRVGSRTAIPEPFPLQGASAALALEKGHVWVAADAYAGMMPFERVDAVAGQSVSTASVDLSALGLDLGWKGIHHTYGLGWVEPQLRSVDNILVARSSARVAFTEQYWAMAAGGGVGVDGRHFRGELAGWGRVTAGLPVTVGVNLTGAWLIFGGRRPTSDAG